ncbi:HAMP domain-containing histidine kinase [Paludibacterium sp. THUN1379]|uniref:sensor histidine kinase n=1 Tax=Paludibacterium sp. THUN1379 TaxID=3112107 RepID=UPI00308B91BB|nr:HAMP domain-containing histidine kinase [Paludibacterium sp. THUN1379]
MPYAVVAVASVAAIMLYLLAIATGNASRLEAYYWWVFGLNSLLLAALIGVVGRQMLRLRARVKSRMFGAKLTQKLVGMFALVALVPGVLIFTISAQFLTGSIESWFDVRVESALDRGLSLGRNALGFVLQDVSRKSHVVQENIQGLDQGALGGRLDVMREELALRQIAIFDRSGRLLAYSGQPGLRAPLPPPRDTLRSISPMQSVDTIENENQTGLLLKVLLGYRMPDDSVRVLMVMQGAPESIARDADMIESARSDYRGLLFNRHGLKTFYMLTLALAFLLALTLALAFALFLSERFSAPLLELAAATRAVAQGDFSRRHPVYRRDELGMLTSMFNRMTRQLDEARQLAEENHRQLEAGKIYLESILANLSAGVIAFDAEWQLRAFNISAARILNVDFDDVGKLPFAEWPQKIPALQALADTVGQQAGDQDRRDWQLQLDYQTSQGERALLIRGARLSELSNAGYVLVFDDITDLARAQRDAAWGEVAKRLAHEIRNPLTPIQLSAERLAMKLADKLEPADAEILHRATDTIVNQVTALKGMVDAFRDYARAPRTKLQNLDVNEVIREVMTLYESNPAVKIDLSDGPLMIMGDAALLRQVLHNLLQNAQDAVLDAENPMIQISSRLEGRNVHVCVEDNGAGFSADILPRAFEPYVTNKSKGTGLGLAVVKKIVEEHQGQIILGNADQHGARILLILPMLEA